MNPDTTQEPDGGLQIDFAIKMMDLYLSEKGVASVGVRRLHYFIVSKPEAERMIPGRGGKPRPYQNTKSQFQRLSELLVQARIKKRADPNKIVDEKNTPLFPMPDRKGSETTWEVTAPRVDSLPDLDVDTLPDWDEWISDISIYPYVSKPVFNNQEYRIVVTIEKATSKAKLKEILSPAVADRQ